MSYRCGLCGDRVPPGTPRLLHRVRYGGGAAPHLRGQVAREVPVCPDCHLKLRIGHTPAELVAEARRDKPETAPPPPMIIPSLKKHAVTFRGQGSNWRPGTTVQCTSVT